MLFINQIYSKRDNRIPITESYVFLSPGNGTVLGLKSASAILLPGGAVSGERIGDLVRLVEGQTGASLDPSGFEFFRQVGSRQYFVYNLPFTLSPRQFESRSPAVKGRFPKYDFYMARHPRPGIALPEWARNFHDCYGDMLHKRLPTVEAHYHEALLCDCGHVTCRGSPIVEVPDNFGGMLGR